MNKEEKIFNLINEDIKNKKISIAYQPVISTKNKKVSSLESLFRFDNSLLNCNLEKVIEVANKYNLLENITNFVLDNIIEDFEYWKNKDIIDKKFTISFNIYSNQLNNNFVENINDKIKNKDIISSNIIIEIKQTSKITKENKEVLNILNNMGFKIALDDINLMKQEVQDIIKLPYHMIKIDRHFVKSAINNKKLNQSVVDNIKLLSKNSNLDIDIVCNGIEDIESANIIEDLNCDYQQGFLYSKPVFKEDIIETIKKIQK